MIPNEKIIYEPICKFLSTKGKQKKADINKFLIKEFNIKPEELSLKREMSGNKVVYNTIGGALNTLQKYGLIVNIEGFWEITDLGKKFLSETTTDFEKEMKKLPKVIPSKKTEDVLVETHGNLEDKNPIIIKSAENDES